ncbi:Receptor protein 12 [Spatholobus suberectus]|nr:Receptor protein 12 [Spatholobus suberectus]
MFSKFTMRAHILFWLFLIPFCLINYATVFSANGYLLGHQCSTLLHLKNSLIFSPTKSRKLTLWNQSKDCCQWHGVTCNEGRVIALDLSEESISGGLVNSSALFSLQYLQSLNLAFNNLRSVIPSELYKLNNLRYLNFSNAGFEELIPLEISHLKKLVTLDLSSSFTSHHRLKLYEPNIGMLLQNFTDIAELYLDGAAISATGQEFNDGVPTPETRHSHTESSIDWNLLSTELGFIFGFGIFIFPLIFWRRWRLWYSKHVDEMLQRIIPQLDFVYEHRGGKRYRTLRWRC